MNRMEESWIKKAVQVAQIGAKVAHSYFRQTLVIEMKENDTPVTQADKRAEMAIREELARFFPGHGILGEELGAENQSSPFVWTIDPIDGTRSFIRGIPLYGTLLGLLYDNEPVLGVMVLPGLGETYYAAKERGAFCNGSPIRVSNSGVLETAFVSCGDWDYFERAGTSNSYLKLLKGSGSCRMLTDCASHAWVARGALDGMIDPAVMPWDVVPIACLVKEAGGVYGDFFGNESWNSGHFITAATQGLFDQIVETISPDPQG